jgi:hypothetical protein
MYGVHCVRSLLSIALNDDVLDLISLVLTRSTFADTISIFLCEVPAILPRFLQRFDLQEGSPSAGNRCHPWP